MAELKKWSNTEVHKLFRLEIKSRQTMLNAEERGEIPKASRVQRGRVQVRQWDTYQLPEIGKKYGFLSKLPKQIIICIYTPKGGVLKTTFALNLARMLALNGMRVIAAGLDIQQSFTKYAIPRAPIESLEEANLPENLGLYHFFFEKAPLSKIIKKTSLPTLDVIPETAELNMLEKKLRSELRREYLIKDKLIPQLQDYDVVIFDNGPSWNQLVENALTAATVVLSPIGCDIETYEALKTNLDIISEFKNAMQSKWDVFHLIPTLLEKTKLSQQIYASYLTNYKEDIIPIPIRRSVTGQEARILQYSAIEYEPSAPLAQDYYEIAQDIWYKITKCQKI